MQPSSPAGQQATVWKQWAMKSSLFNHHQLIAMKPIYSIDAPNQAKLKVARTEIEAILHKHDLAGVVVLHTPGMAEFFYDIRPSYSCAWIDEQRQMVRIKSAAKDYAGNTQAQLHDQAATANLFSSITANLEGAWKMFGDVAKVVDRATRAQHTAGARVADPMETRPQ